MNGGVKNSLLLSCFVLAGCTASAPVEVRAISNPSDALSRGGDAVATARGQLMLGNTGLALEGFRKAQRANPYDPAALAGIGDCYSAMGRFDIAQTNYEAALALSPHDTRLLLGLAAIYEKEGKIARAMIARAEAAALNPAPAAPKRAQSAAVAPVSRPEGAVAIPKPVIGSITVELPAARPAERVAERAPAPVMPQLAEADAPPAVPAPVLGDVEVVDAVPAQSLAQAGPLPAALTFASEPIAVAPPAMPSTVTVELPAARASDRLDPRPVPQRMAQIEEPVEPAPSVTVPLPPARPAPVPLPRQEERGSVAVALAPAPRLERLSRGEVALVTTGKTLWRSPEGVRTASANTTVRWVALASAKDKPNVRILNAARSQGLAASARTVLFDRGWRKIAVGDAPAVVRKSVVLYPKGREELGRRLARQFGVSAQMAERDDVVLLLGRDSVRRTGG